MTKGLEAQEIFAAKCCSLAMFSNSCSKTFSNIAVMIKVDDLYIYIYIIIYIYIYIYYIYIYNIYIYIYIYIYVYIYIYIIYI